MALKKSELYSSLWSSCDELRGGMDASQYKDYVLVLLFIKYVSDKYAGVPFAPITIPARRQLQGHGGAQGQADIGDQINKKIIAPLANANKLSDLPDFNDATKLGSGKEMVDRLTNLIAIFENRALDFSKNRADGDDILGDAYEYLMRHFATESGKSKGQFYTPAEVSRIIAQILGIRTRQDHQRHHRVRPHLRLRLAAAEGGGRGRHRRHALRPGEGRCHQRPRAHEHDPAQQPHSADHAGQHAGRSQVQGPATRSRPSTTSSPIRRSQRQALEHRPRLGCNDPYERFKPFGVPPAKQGDYAYLLHIVRSLKSTGKGACILPHGVLFRGNAEGDIRRALVRKGYIKGIIGLPANLFYGTGIPACIVVVDKQDAQTRTGIFMIDASAGFEKDGPKNRLRAQDIHKIVDVFNKRLEVPRFSRMVPFDEIERNEFNLNLPRYIDSQEAEDRQDIEGHLRGGIPEADVAALESYWAVCPQLRQALFKPDRPGYLALAVDKAAIKPAIYGHPEFAAFIATMNAHFAAWRQKSATTLRELQAGCHPKQVIADLAEGLLAHYAARALIDPYDIYQHLMDYWAETMQDDCYLIAADGWKATTYRIVETDKKGKQKDKGWACDLVPKQLVVARFFAAEQAVVDALAAELEGVSARLAELEEEHGGEEGLFVALDKVNRASVTARLREIRGLYATNDEDTKEEAAALDAWIDLSGQEADLKRKLKETEATLDAKAYARYSKLSEAEIKALVVDDKWLAALDAAVHGEMERISQALTRRVRELAERYATPMPQMARRVDELEARVSAHLERMGYALS